MVGDEERPGGEKACHAFVAVGEWLGEDDGMQDSGDDACVVDFRYHDGVHYVAIEVVHDAWKGVEVGAGFVCVFAGDVCGSEDAAVAEDAVDVEGDASHDVVEGVTRGDDASVVVLEFGEAKNFDCGSGDAVDDHERKLICLRDSDRERVFAGEELCGAADHGATEGGFEAVEVVDQRDWIDVRAGESGDWHGFLQV